jgi:hypothetical protein
MFDVRFVHALSSHRMFDVRFVHALRKQSECFNQLKMHTEEYRRNLNSNTNIRRNKSTKWRHMALHCVPEQPMHRLSTR